MLQVIRDWATGWVATAIVALLIIPFAFWGINYYFGGTEPVVAVVDGQEVKLTQFQRAYANFRLQMQALLDQDLGAADDEWLKRQALEKLVESEILNRATRAAGLRVSDEQVMETIKNIEVFRGEGGFNRDFYEQSVRRLGMQPSVYEQQLRLDMATEQLQSAVIDSVFVSEREALEAARLKNQRRDLVYTIIPADRYRGEITVTEEDIETFYRENAQLYRKPEQVRIAYIELSLDQLAAEVAVSEQELRDYHAANRAKYDIEEQRKISQILIKTGETTGDAAVAEVRARAEEILQAIRGGGSFEEIAREYAEKLGPEFSLTEYGFLKRGILQEEIDAAAFAMQVDEISDVIQSKLGFHIIKLIEIRGGEMNSFENARDEVERDYRHAAAEAQFIELADQLAALSYEHPDTLEFAAESTGLAIRQSGLFTRSGGEEGFTAHPAVISASFSEDVLIGGNNSEILEITDSHLAVLRVIDHLPEAESALEEVREDIRKDVEFTRASLRAHEKGQAILAGLREGKTFEAVAEEEAVEWQHAADVTRDDVNVNRTVLRTAFRLGRPEDGKPVTGGVPLGSGDYVVIAVTTVNTPDRDTVGENEIKDIKLQLGRQRATMEWGQVLQELRARADVKLFTDRI